MLVLFARIQWVDVKLGSKLTISVMVSIKLDVLADCMQVHINTCIIMDNTGKLHVFQWFLCVSEHVTVQKHVPTRLRRGDSMQNVEGSIGFYWNLADCMQVHINAIMDNTGTMNIHLFQWFLCVSEHVTTQKHVATRL